MVTSMHVLHMHVSDMNMSGCICSATPHKCGKKGKQHNRLTRKGSWLRTNENKTTKRAHKGRDGRKNRNTAGIGTKKIRMDKKRQTKRGRDRKLPIQKKHTSLVTR